MFHICFCANESYIKYTAVLINSIVKNTDTTKAFADFFTKNPPPIWILIKSGILRF